MLEHLPRARNAIVKSDPPVVTGHGISKLKLLRSKLPDQGIERTFAFASNFMSEMSMFQASERQFYLDRPDAMNETFSDHQRVHS